jgi:hypothetical protein
MGIVWKREHFFFPFNGYYSVWKNTISSLVRADGSIVVEYHEKVGILLQSERDRLGFSTPIDSNFNFADYIQRDEHFDSLYAPFSHEEIDAVAADLPPDKAPGPDGFTGLFIKTCWPIIKFDLYCLCQELWEESVNIQSLMTSLSRLC